MSFPELDIKEYQLCAVAALLLLFVMTTKASEHHAAAALEREELPLQIAAVSSRCLT